MSFGLVSDSGLFLGGAGRMKKTGLRPDGHSRWWCGWLRLCRSSPENDFNGRTPKHLSHPFYEGN